MTTPAKCPRCAGLMLLGESYFRVGPINQMRCSCCGHITDPIMEHNLKNPPTEDELYDVVKLPGDRSWKYLSTYRIESMVAGGSNFNDIGAVYNVPGSTISDHYKTMSGMSFKEAVACGALKPLRYCLED